MTSPSPNARHGCVYRRPPSPLLTICYATPANGVRSAPTNTSEIRTAEHEWAPKTTGQDELSRTHNPLVLAGGMRRQIGLLEEFSGTQIENITVHDRQDGWPAATAGVIRGRGQLWEDVGFVDRDALAAVRVAGVSGVTTG